MAEPTKFLLSEDQIPTHWINLIPDLPGDPLPPLNPATMQPAGPDDLAPIFPMALIEQEVSAEPEIEIPEEVREAYRLWRPTPLFRARAPGARARYAGAHLLQVRGRLPGRLAQAEHRGAAGLRQQAGRASTSSPPRPARASGAPRWRSRARCSGWSARSSWSARRYDQKPYRRSMMQTWGATVHRSPSDRTEAGRVAGRAPDRLARHRDLRGGRGRRAARRHELRARLGAQPRAAAPDGDRPGGDRPDGAGRRRAGRRHRLRRRRLELRRASRSRSCAGVLRGEAQTRFVAAEPAACPTLTRGVYRYDFGDTVGLTPLMPMYTLGHDFVPPPVHAGGLRYHGDSPLVCALVKEGLVEARAYRQNETLRGGAAVRPHRGHHPGAGARARDPGGDRRGRGGARGRRGARDPLQPVRATATSTWPPTTPTSPASSRTRSSPRPTWRPRSRGCRRRRRSPDPYSGSMALSGEHTVEIAAAIQHVYAIAADLEQAPEWQGSLQAVTVLERDAPGRAVHVETIPTRRSRRSARSCASPMTRTPRSPGRRRRAT